MSGCRVVIVIVPEDPRGIAVVVVVLAVPQRPEERREADQAQRQRHGDEDG